MEKAKLSFWQIWNMSFGFFGIQFGFALQGGSMTRIFQTLGASTEEIPLLWIAAPLTGLIVQPVIGYMSDRTWTSLGRRRPYFLVGAILSSIALIFMPHSPALWIAAGCLWILDASINISMEPFRALVADNLPEEQRTFGFSMQSVIIGLGAVVASFMPKILTMAGVSNEAGKGIIPDNVKYSFYIGAIFFMGTILWSVFNTKEYPPEDLDAFEEEKKKGNIFTPLMEIFSSIGSMPKTMLQLGIVQFFTWFALFGMWAMSVPAITSHVFGITDVDSKAYNDAADNFGIWMAAFNFVAALSAIGFPFLAKQISRKGVHSLCLMLGAIGLGSIYFVSGNTGLLISYSLVGIAWGSILSMPYAMLSASIPAEKMGIYMGLFNMFIVIPQILASLGALNFLTKTFFGSSSIWYLVLASIFMFIASISVLFVQDSSKGKAQNL